MNRWWRREVQRMERRRQRRLEELRRRREERRRRALTRWVAPGQPRPSLREWLRRPYKPADLLLMVLLVWLVRGAAAAALGGARALAEPRAALVVLVAQHAALLVLVLGYLRAVAREPVQWLGPDRGRGARAALAGMAGGAALALAERGVTLLAARAGWGQALVPPLPPGVEAAGAAGIAVAVVLAPLAEELFYRRWLLRLFARTGVPVRTGVLLSALLFAFAHTQPAAVLLAWVGGIAYGALYARTGATLAVVLMHAAHNALALALR